MDMTVEGGAESRSVRSFPIAQQQALLSLGPVSGKVASISRFVRIFFFSHTPPPPPHEGFPHGAGLVHLFGRRGSVLFG